MALILISVQDTPTGPMVSVVAEPAAGPLDQATQAEQVASAMLAILPRPDAPPQPTVYTPPTKLILPN